MYHQPYRNRGSNHACSDGPVAKVSEKIDQFETLKQELIVLPVHRRSAVMELSLSKGKDASSVSDWHQYLPQQYNCTI